MAEEEVLQKIFLLKAVCMSVFVCYEYYLLLIDNCLVDASNFMSGPLSQRFVDTSRDEVCRASKRKIEANQLIVNSMQS